GPRARRIDDDPSADLAGGRGHAFDLTRLHPDTGDGRLWNEGDPLAAAGLQIRLEQARRLVDVDVVRGVARRPDSLALEKRHQAVSFVAVDELEVHSPGLRLPRLLPAQRGVLARPRDQEAAGPNDPGRTAVLVVAVR